MNTSRTDDGRFAHLVEALAGLDAKGLRRRHRTASPAEDMAGAVDGTRVTLDGRDAPLLNVCGNDYLGLATDPRVVAAAASALRRYGAGARASRLIVGHSPAHAEVESKLAALKHQEAALVLPSGYAANLAVMTALARPGDMLFADAANHASLNDGCRLSGAIVRRYAHNDMADLRRRVANEPPPRGGRGRRFLVTDGVFSMDGDVAPLAELAALADEIDACLVVDDAHGTGVLGATGAGAAEALGVAGHPSVVHVGTLSKALGSQGGFVAGPAVLVDYLVNTARPHIFTTGLAPASAAAASAALDILQAEPWRRERVCALAGRLREALRRLGFRLAGEASDVPPGGPAPPIVPVVVGEAEEATRLSRQLAERGVLAPAVRPPTVPAGSSRVRVTLMATHTDDDVELLIDAFAEAAPSGS